MEKNKYYVKITPHRAWFDLRLGEIRKYKDLIFIFVKRAFTVSYKQTILGPLWLFISPLFSSVIYTVVFGTIVGLSTDGVPKILFYLVGNAFWGYFSSCLSGNQSIFVSNAHLFGKVYFPRLVIPIAHVLRSLVRLGIQLLLVSGFLIYYIVAGDVAPKLAALPLILPAILQLALLGMGSGLIISSVTTKYRDLSVLIGFGLRMWMYATPVIYPLSQIKGNTWLYRLILLNPVTQPLEQLRYGILGVGTISLRYSLLSWGITLVILLLGVLIFNRVERTFIDTV